MTEIYAKRGLYIYVSVCVCFYLGFYSWFCIHFFSNQAKELQANFVHLSLLSKCVFFLFHLLFYVMSLVSDASSINFFWY